VSNHAGPPGPFPRPYFETPVLVWQRYFRSSFEAGLTDKVLQEDFESALSWTGCQEVLR